MSSAVKDVLMPPIGMLLGGVDFASFAIQLEAKTADAEAVTLNYGLFVNTVIDFLIIAFAIFLIVKAINAMKRREQENPSAPPQPSGSPVSRISSRCRHGLRWAWSPDWVLCTPRACAPPRCCW